MLVRRVTGCCLRDSDRPLVLVHMGRHIVCYVSAQRFPALRFAHVESRW